MELRDFIAIFRRQAWLFWGIIILSMVGALVWQRSQPVSYQVSLLLNVGRVGAEETPDYTFDDFYRLQADERFADTVVRWLGSPRVVEDIYADQHLDSGILSLRDLQGTFRGSRLSSQMIDVSYSGNSEQTVRALSRSVIRVLNRYAESLNQEHREANWFVLIGSDPVIRDGRVGLSLAIGAGLLAGLFVVFWIVLLRHYFFRNEYHADRN